MNEKLFGWAIENGITAGVGGGKFDPDSTCTLGSDRGVPVTWFSPATRIRLSGVRTLMRTLHFCVRWTASLMKLRYSSCGARASAGRNWIRFLYRLAK